MHYPLKLQQRLPLRPTKKTHVFFNTFVFCIFRQTIRRRISLFLLLFLMGLSDCPIPIKIKVFPTTFYLHTYRDFLNCILSASYQPVYDVIMKFFQFSYSLSLFPPTSYYWWLIYEIGTIIWRYRTFSVIDCLSTKVCSNKLHLMSC